MWVGYDSTLAPTEVWTYWHGTILHTPVAEESGRDKRAVGQARVIAARSGSRQTCRPFGRSTSSMRQRSFSYPTFCSATPCERVRFGFFHSYKRYRDFTRPMLLAERLDAVVRTDDPDTVLRAFFGKYSRKPAWPPGI